MHISPNLQEILLPHTLMRKPSILRKVPTEVTTIQNLCQQQPPTLLIRWHYHLILRQSKHLMKHTHHRPLRTSTIQDASVLSVPKAAEAEESVVEAELTEVKKELAETSEAISPIASRRSHPAQSSEDRFGPSTNLNSITMFLFIYFYNFLKTFQSFAFFLIPNRQ